MKQIRIIAPARSIQNSERANLAYGEKTFSKIGYGVTYGKQVFDTDFFDISASIKKRISDWNDAWQDKNIDYILAYNGGTNSNQLLDYIDWEALKNTEKIFIGYSDLTVIANALYAKNNKISFLGLNFKYFCRKKILNYTPDNVHQALTQSEYIVTPSSSVNMNIWNDSPDIEKSQGWWSIQAGSMTGRVIGGNLPSFRLLYGTEYMPDISNSVLFIEWDNFTIADLEEFNRELEALTMQKGFDTVAGIIIGRFQTESEISREHLSTVIENKKKLKGIPIIANVDFGHTEPMFIFPVGGFVEVEQQHQALKFKY